MILYYVSFTKKQQARIWLVSIVYECLIKNCDLPKVPKLEYHGFGKGDFIYFNEIYSKLFQYFPQADLSCRSVIDIRSISILFRAILLCFACEGLNLEEKVLFAEYIKLLTFYGERDSNQLLRKIFEKLNIC